MNDKISIDMDKEMEELSFNSPAPQTNDKISVDKDKEMEELTSNSPAPQMNDKISIDMDKELEELSSNLPDCCIFRVHDELRNKNRMAYDPTLIAIGLYHKGNVKLQMMEEHKLRYLKLLLQRKDMSINDLVIPMKSLEEEARRCYAQPINLDSEKFIRMLILDGCFIIELAFKFWYESIREQNDPIFRHDWMLISLQRDLMLFENQLPFFVLLKIYEIFSRGVPYELHGFYGLFVLFFENVFPVSGCTRSLSRENAIEVKHLLELIYLFWLGPPTEKESEGMTNSIFLFGCATTLKEANIKFKKTDDGFRGIKFSGGMFEIPQLKITDWTESFLRNMIAFEQHGRLDSYSLVTCYVKLMDSLIDTSKDVELLCHRGIIDNWLGNDEVVAELFNKMTENVLIPFDNFLYVDIFKKVNDHCESPFNKQIASLRHKYLNSPWAIISVLAGLVLLIFTITQTVVPRK